ncbi:hypothetical protein SODG_005293 [Sodalis praecaptivus]
MRFSAEKSPIVWGILRLSFPALISGTHEGAIALAL